MNAKIFLVSSCNSKFCHVAFGCILHLQVNYEATMYFETLNILTLNYFMLV
jgi:hypothetical protein